MLHWPLPIGVLVDDRCQDLGQMVPMNSESMKGLIFLFYFFFYYLLDLNMNILMSVIYFEKDIEISMNIENLKIICT